MWPRLGVTRLFWLQEVKDRSREPGVMRLHEASQKDRGSAPGWGWGVETGGRSAVREARKLPEPWTGVRDRSRECAGHGRHRKIELSPRVTWGSFLRVLCLLYSKPEAIGI